MNSYINTSNQDKFVRKCVELISRKLFNRIFVVEECLDCSVAKYLFILNQKKTTDAIRNRIGISDQTP